MSWSMELVKSRGEHGASNFQLWHITDLPVPVRHSDIKLFILELLITHVYCRHRSSQFPATMLPLGIGMALFVSHVRYHCLHT
jgi:hypothetical protein